MWNISNESLWNITNGLNLKNFPSLICKFLIFLKTNFNEFSLLGYATVTTGHGTLIIWGHPLLDMVACCNRSGWRQLDRLNNSRQYHCSNRKRGWSFYRRLIWGIVSFEKITSLLDFLVTNLWWVLNYEFQIYRDLEERQ